MDIDIILYDVTNNWCHSYDNILQSSGSIKKYELLHKIK